MRPGQDAFTAQFLNVLIRAPSQLHEHVAWKIPVDARPAGVADDHSELSLHRSAAAGHKTDNREPEATGFQEALSAVARTCSHARKMFRMWKPEVASPPESRKP